MQLLNRFHPNVCCSPSSPHILYRIYKYINNTYSDSSVCTPPRVPQSCGTPTSKGQLRRVAKRKESLRYFPRKMI